MIKSNGNIKAIIERLRQKIQRSKKKLELEELQKDEKTKSLNEITGSKYTKFVNQVSITTSIQGEI